MADPMVVISLSEEQIRRMQFHLRVLEREYERAVRALRRARKPRSLLATNEELAREREGWIIEVKALRRTLARTMEMRAE